MLAYRKWRNIEARGFLLTFEDFSIDTPGSHQRAWRAEGQTVWRQHADIYACFFVLIVARVCCTTLCYVEVICISKCA